MMTGDNQDTLNQKQKWLKWFLAAVLLMGMMLYFYYVYPGQGMGPKQPISFSHRVHAGVKAINCRFCHPYVERSEHAGLPEMEKCFFCHKYIIPTHQEILKEKEYFEQRPAGSLGQNFLCS